MNNPILVTNCIKYLWIITIICVMVAEQNTRLDCRMCRFPTIGKAESSHFYIIPRGKLLFVSQVFYKEGQIVKDFYIGV